MDPVEIEIEKDLADFKNHFLEKTGPLYLTKYQQEILTKHHIPYQKCQNIQELLFFLSHIPDEEDYDELEEVAKQIAEFHYYHEIRK